SGAACPPRASAPMRGTRPTGGRAPAATAPSCRRSRSRGPPQARARQRDLREQQDERRQGERGEELAVPRVARRLDLHLLQRVDLAIDGLERLRVLRAVVAAAGERGDLAQPG